MQFRNLIFVSGKGGTGKSTLAVLLAAQLARKGRRTLLIELNERSSLQSLLQSSSAPTYEPQKTPWGFAWARLTGREGLLEYLGHFVRAQALTRKVLENNVIKTLVNVAPGLNDLAILGKLTSHDRQHGPGWDHDHLIVDAPSTGSFYSLLAAPLRLGSSVARGPLHTQSSGIDRVLRDPQKTQFVFVGLAEELPTDELLETWDLMEKGYPGQSQIVINKHLPIQRPHLSAPLWQTYLQSRLEIQEEQLRRVRTKVERVELVPHFFESLRERIQSPGYQELSWQ